MPFVPKQSSCAKNGELAIDVEDQLHDAILFLITIDQYAPIKEYLLKGYFEDDIPKGEKEMFHHKIKTIYNLWSI